MKNRFNRTLSILCAVLLLISAVSAWAIAEETATPTDLKPTKETERIPAGNAIGDAKVIITKALAVGQSWEGTVTKEKLVVMQLDMAKSGHVYMLVEGKNVWVSKVKSDNITEDSFCFQTDSETEQILLDWEAEEGSSYLITLGPVEPNNEAKAKVTIMDKKAYEAWMETQAQIASETEDNHDAEAIEETETDPEEGIETEQESEPEADIESESAEEDKEPEEADEQEEQPEAEPVSEENEPVQESEELEEKPEEKQPEENEQKTEKATETKQPISETELITEEENLEDNTGESVDLPDDNTLLTLGYYKVQIGMAGGADLYTNIGASDPIDHLEVGQELWLTTTDNSEWARVYTNEGDPLEYVLWNAVIITKYQEKEQDNDSSGEQDRNDDTEDIQSGDINEKEDEKNEAAQEETIDDENPETTEEELAEDEETEVTEEIPTEEMDLPARYLKIQSTIANKIFIRLGEEVTMTVILQNFKEDDVCSYQWQYYDTTAKAYVDIEGANDSVYKYLLTNDTISSNWRVVVTISNE